VSRVNRPPISLISTASFPAWTRTVRNNFTCLLHAAHYNQWYILTWLPSFVKLGPPSTLSLDHTMITLQDGCHPSMRTLCTGYWPHTHTHTPGHCNWLNLLYWGHCMSTDITFRSHVATDCACTRAYITVYEAGVVCGRHPPCSHSSDSMIKSYGNF